MMDKKELIYQLKQQIIKQLNLAGKTPEDIRDDDPLFVEGLGLDSIDALELIVLLQQEYNIKLKSAEEGQTIFRSVATMADYILEQQAGAAN
ncbi:phosphopantetheine-binding protein [Niabella sp. W65]|nr:phosphopantetheine-binding protein [Niabella sp. W65]MCH7369231.1 phosphopantetheine-binding protein [Niabella sp. W65]ULT44777.1 phosphopantetheine-binding protein [Niabella sp. I65]